MINGRVLGVETAGLVFRHGHMGWFYADKRGVARGPYGSREEAAKERGCLHPELACERGHCECP